jgi:hypothetical protein
MSNYGFVQFSLTPASGSEGAKKFYVACDGYGYCSGKDGLEI